MSSNQNLSKSQTLLSPQDKRLLLERLLREKASNTKSFYPLSYGQQALWFLYQSAPKSSAYNTAFAVRIRSNVEVPALKSAFQKMVNRHPSLRTTFPMRDGEIVQEVHGYQDVCFEEIDASSWSWDELNSRAIEAYQRPFELEQGPLLRVTLFSRSDCDRLLLLTIHHIVNDGWSLWMLLEELGVLYTAQITGQKAFLPPATLSYADYIQWQTDMLASSQGEQLWNYWKNQLAGELPTLDLPTDRPRSPIQTYRGASSPLKLNKKLTQQLKRLAQNEGATLYMTLLAAFQVLLYRYTGQEDILVGSPTAGRDQSNFAGIVGYFVNPVVLRGNLGGNPTFKDFLGQIRQTALDAIAHQDYPFPLLVERLQPNRDSSRSPLFQSLFVLQKPHKKELAELITPSETQTYVNWGGLEMEFFPMITEEGQFDLTLEMVEAKESLFSLFKYNSDLFDDATMTRMAGHFQTLLESIVANPQQRLADLPLLSSAQRQRVLVDWNNTHQDYPFDIPIHQLFETQVQRTPNAVALVFEQEKLTYQALNCRANQLAHYLQKLGVGPEVLVGICIDRSIEMVVGLLAILKAGGTYVPLDPAYPQERLTYMLSDSQMPVLLSLKNLVAKLPEHQADVVCLDKDWKIISQESEDNTLSSVTAENLAYVIYTSGSTGKPKGVQICHQSVVNFLNSMRLAPGLTEQDILLAVTTISFDIAALELYLPLIVGAQVVLVTREVASDGEQLKSLVVNSGTTTMQATPATWRLLLAAGWEGNPQMKILCGGEALPRQLANQLLETGASVWNLYGPTETTIWSAICEVGVQRLAALSKEMPESIGRPIANTQIHLLDRQLQPVPIGVSGELHIGGAGLARGYLNRPDLTAEKFIPNPFSQETEARLYKTGDLARYLPDGTIEYLGRIDHQVKIRGFRIELGEIEAVLAQHPKVRETVVIARDFQPGDQHLVAYVVPAQEPPTSNELRRFLKEQLPDYMVPSAFVLLDALPLTPNGKVNRRALPAPDHAKSSREETHVPPRDALEWQLLQIWEQVLKVAPISVRDDFFAIGGHSLLAVRLMAKIQQQFDKNIPLAALFQNSTIEQLAELLRQQTDSLSWSPLVTIQSGGSKPPFFCLPGAGGNVIYLYDLVRHLGEDQPVYGLQAVGLDGEAQPLTSIEELATHYREILQNVQPEGPYFLGGHSSGGLVAFEIAQQLREGGQEVALVAILDSEAPVRDRPPVGVDWDDARWLIRITGVIERFLNKNLDISYDALRLLEPDEQFNYVGERLKISGLLPPEAGIKQVRGLLQVFKANFQACDRYQPRKVYPTPITLFRAEEIHSEDTGSEVSFQLQQEPTWGWNQVCVEPVDLHVIPGDHITMLAEPHVQVLAQRLRVCIEQAGDC